MRKDESKEPVPDAELRRDVAKDPAALDEIAWLLELDVEKAAVGELFGLFILLEDGVDWRTS